MSFNLLNRLTLGANQSMLESFNAVGETRWLEEQLHPSENDPALEQRLSSAVFRINYGATSDYAAVNENRPLTLWQKPLKDLWSLTDYQIKLAHEERIRPLRELMAARLIRGVYSPWQLQELMVDFWLDHFNVHAGDVQVAVAMPSFEQGSIRQHGLGNFKNLLESVAQSTPMLIYLNNRSSRTGAPNENYARELFELHTMGKDNYLNNLYSKWKQVPGAQTGAPTGYIDQDVYEAARAFTGWMIEDARQMGSGVKLPNTGAFTYSESWHDPYQKRILAQDFDPFDAPMADGKRVLDMLSGHPGTAHHLSEKICRRFVSDTPPRSLVDSTTKVWLANIKHPRQIALVMQHIFKSNEFKQALADRRQRKLKRPFELAVSFIRQLDLPFSPSMGLVNEISSAGQRMYLWPTPDGHPDQSAYWLSTHTMRRRWNIPLGLIENWWATGFVGAEHLSAQFKQPLNETTLIAHHAQNMLGEGQTQETLSLMNKALQTPPKRLLGAGNDEWVQVKRQLAYIAMSPAYQYR